ncbi:hypothetical protein ACU686_16300 [Yinghuangia aomiensis]
MVLGRRMDILAWNPRRGPPHRLLPTPRQTAQLRPPGLLRLGDATALHELGEGSPDRVAFLRMEAARHPDDPRLEAEAAGRANDASRTPTSW